MRRCAVIAGLLCLAACSAARGAGSAPGSLSLTLPGIDWVLELAAPGFALEEKEVVEKGDAARLFAVNETSGLLVSAFLEKADHPGDADECRAFYWGRGKKSPSRKDELAMSDSGGMALLHYIVREEGGVPLNQKHMNAYLSRDGYWIDIHLSKVAFKPGEEKFFKEFLDGVSFRPKAALAGKTSPRRYALAEHGSVSLDVPEPWRDEVERPPRNLPPTIVFRPPSGDEFRILLTPLWHAGNETGFNSPDKIKPLARKAGEKALQTAVENKLELVEFRGPSTAGYCYSLTDRAPKPGEWKHLTQGSFGIDDLLVSFTVLTNEKDSPDAKAALEMLRTMRRERGKGS